MEAASSTSDAPLDTRSIALARLLTGRAAKTTLATARRNWRGTQATGASMRAAFAAD